MKKIFISLALTLIALLIIAGYYFYHNKKSTNEISTYSQRLQENEIISIHILRTGGYLGNRNNFEITLVKARFSKVSLYSVISETEKYYGAIDSKKFDYFCSLLNKINFNSFLNKHFSEGSEHVDYKFEIKTWGGKMVIENISKEYPKEFTEFIDEIEKFGAQSNWTKTDEASAKLLVEIF